MTSYRYILADLRTNTILDELPFTDVGFDLKLNGAGSFSARLPIADAAVKALDPLSLTTPGRTALYVDRDGVLLWGGIVWVRTYGSDKASISVTAQEFESYFAHRFITADANFTATDQLTIARSLITTAQAATGGSIGVVHGSNVSGVTRDRLYEGWQLKPVLEALQQLAAVNGGFDFAIDVAWSGNVPTKTLSLGYPRRGTIANLSGLMFEYPGNIQSYEWPEDSTSQATTSYATGEGVGQGQGSTSSVNTALITAGYPLLEAKTAYSVTGTASLQTHSDADLAALASTVTVPTITVRADADPTIGSYVVGDEVRLRITDHRFTTPLDVFRRIVAISIRPPGSGAESVTLTLGDVVA